MLHEGANLNFDRDPVEADNDVHGPVSVARLLTAVNDFRRPRIRREQARNLRGQLVLLIEPDSADDADPG